jgi:hypothetical protein
MKLLYFTLGTSLLDEQVRRQLIRIPEVLSEIRKVKLQPKFRGQDAVMAFLGLNDLSQPNLKGNLQDWVAVVQKGLFNRLRKSGLKYSGLFKRNRMTSNLENIFVPLLQSKSKIEIYVIGPGFDDLKTQIDRIQKKFRLNCDVVLIDVISQDPKLKWFWSGVTKPVVVENSMVEVGEMRH